MLYYKCECGEKINKIATEIANADYDYLVESCGQIITQCPKCGVKYKITKPATKILSIMCVVMLIVMLVIDFIFSNIGFYTGLFLIFAPGFIVAMLQRLLGDDYFKKITDEPLTKGEIDET